MNKRLIRFIIFFHIFALIPPVVDLVGEQRSKKLSFEQLVVKVFQRLSIYLYAFVSKFQKIFSIAKNNSSLVQLFLVPLIIGFINHNLLFFC